MVTFLLNGQINVWLESVRRWCGSRCRIYNIGRTGEGRVMKVIKISGNSRRMNYNHNKSRQAIWIDGGIHAREWISPVTATNLIYKVCTFITALLQLTVYCLNLSIQENTGSKMYLSLQCCSLLLFLFKKIKESIVIFFNSTM